GFLIDSPLRLGWWIRTTYYDASWNLDLWGNNHEGHALRVLRGRFPIIIGRRESCASARSAASEGGSCSTPPPGAYSLRSSPRPSAAKRNYRSQAARTPLAARRFAGIRA